jgi:D-3-phosphoglycerate dehydrogenase
MTDCRVLVTRHVYPEALELLGGDVDVTYHDSRDGMTRAEFTAAVADKHALLCQLTDRIDAALLDAASEMRIIANVAVGYDNIDVAAASRRGILVTNTPDVLTQSTADLAFALLMATARRLTEAERFLREGRWRQWEIDLLSGVDVHGSTLGIIGMGRIGQALARRARGFDMRVIYHSRTRLDPALERELSVTPAPLDTLLDTADIVSVHVPLTPETKGMIAARELARMQPTSVLINTSRGSIVDEDALVEVLRSGGIRGAGLDVFASEPAVDRRLLALDNVVLLPHIASSTVATRTRMCCMAAENIRAFARGGRPPNVVAVDGVGVDRQSRR